MPFLRRFLAAFLIALPAINVLAAPVAMLGESLLLSGTTPGTLCYPKVDPDSVQVRSNYDSAAADTIVYQRDRDYTLDAAQGTLARTQDSRIPDFSTNVLYGQKDFDHTKFPGYGNRPFFVYVDYIADAAQPFFSAAPQPEALPKTREKLQRGGHFKIITFGDSISAGGEASTEALRFDHRYAAALRTGFPEADITVENGATGGDSTVQGLQRLEEKVLTRTPDLVLVGFGMNDHNLNGVPTDAFENNLVNIVEQIHTRTGADVILFSAFPPNPDWKYGSHRMEQYAAATQRAATRSGAAYADVYAVWQAALARKDLPSLLANNINHPNDFGHALYALALQTITFGAPH